MEAPLIGKAEWKCAREEVHSGFQCYRRVGGVDTELKMDPEFGCHLQVRIHASQSRAPSQSPCDPAVTLGEDRIRDLSPTI